MGSRYDSPFAHSDTKIILSLDQPSTEDNTVMVESLASPLSTRTAFSHYVALLNSQPIESDS